MGPSAPATLHLATWNVNSLSVRLPQVLDWLATQSASGQRVDVLALQELKLAHDKFPHALFADIGYHAAWLGQKTYNGVALLSRYPLRDVTLNLPGFDDEQARLVAATLEVPGAPPRRVVGAYFPNGQAPGSEKFAYKMRWLSALHTWLANELRQYPQLVLMGDFNITFDDADVWDPEGMREAIHCTHEERSHLQALLALGLHDALRLRPQPPKSYTWWDYRMLCFQKNRGLRIDHILVSDALRPQVQACRIDRAPRKNTQPSDHAPVCVTLSGAPTPAPVPASSG